MMESKERPQSVPTRLALVGLIGTILTVCGGLTGAVIGGLTTIYKVNQETQRLSIAAPESDQPLLVNTRQVGISSSKVIQLDPEKYLIFQDLGFVMGKPTTGWDQSKSMTFSDLFLEQGTDLSPLILFSKWIKNTWDDQPVQQIRYQDPVTVQFIKGSTENGVAIDPTQLENDKINFYSRFIILALDKTQIQKNFTIYDLALDWGELHQGGVNDIIANPDSQYVFEQVSWKFRSVLVANHQVDLTLQRWALFAEGPDRYYIIEIQYVPVAGQSMQVFDDLQSYLKAFRVIQ